MFVSSPLLWQKTDVFAGKMGLLFSVKTGWFEWFKKRISIVFTSICGQSKEVSQERTSGWLESTLPAL
jgi:hypothetical protein